MKPRWTITDYDVEDRVILSVAADGAQTQIGYYTDAGRAVVETKSPDCFVANPDAPCVQTRSRTDGLGRVILKGQNDTLDTDTGSSVGWRQTTYSYDLRDQLTGVTDPAGETWAYTSDGFGNRLSADDPGLGVWTMTYDPNGNLEDRFDAKGQIISFAYDALNRVTDK